MNKIVIPLTLCCLTSFASSGYIYFNDPKLENTVREVLKISGPITSEDMTHLYGMWPMYGIRDLTGLEYAVNLGDLEIRGGEVSDLNPLAGLTGLYFLALDNHHIRDISPISKLTGIVSLELIGNEIQDISPLANFPYLTSLLLDHNQIRDISPLAGLTNLRLVVLNDNPLNEQAYTTYLPQIIANNPGIQIYYDPIPEPASLLILGLGGFWLRKKRHQAPILAIGCLTPF